MTLFCQKKKKVTINEEANTLKEHFDDFLFPLTFYDIYLDNYKI